MSLRFVHESLPQRVIFAAGEAAERVVDEVGRLGAARPMIIAADGRDELVEPILAGLPGAVRHTEVTMHVPVDVAERARAAAAAAGADALVSVGGGSTTGLAKAVALTSGLPIIAVPTTYAGSEATDVWGLTEDGVKTTGADPRVLPRVIIYDATLSLSLPVATSVASGLNAIAHGVDALWGPRTDPIDQAQALEGVRVLRSSLPAVAAAPADLDAREQTLYGSYIASVAFASAGSGLHHKICHALGGLFNLPHAPTHAVVLPHVLALNAPAVPDLEPRLAAALAAPTALQGLLQLRDQLAAPRSLAELGLTADDLGRAVDAILPTVPPGNPTPVTAEILLALLRDALIGADPSR